MKLKYRNFYVPLTFLVLGGIVVLLCYSSISSTADISNRFQKVIDFISKIPKNVSGQSTSREFDVKVFTVETREIDGYVRMIRSANYYNIEVKTLGIGHDWSGFGTKVNLLREALEPYKKEEQQIILYIDADDLMFATTIDDIVQRFKNLDVRILFGAERAIWPDESLEPLYPNVSKHFSKYLNAGVFIGYASDLYELMRTPIENREDDQLYFTKAFLNENIRKNLQFQLDYGSEIIQNLNNAKDDIEMLYNKSTGEYYIKNTKTGTIPCIIHASGVSETFLNDIGRYLASTFDHNLRQQFHSE